MFDADSLGAALMIPQLVSDYSAWVGHIPFAFTLIELLRPRVLVELGTHKGDSYCAFCQAVEILDTDTRCTAVDTWIGDGQAGYYDSSVLAELKAHHDARYGSFSTLRQSSFDDAASHFAEGSIDLLHLDGAHEYDAVRQDFAMWRERLSDAAVVLFHDTRVFADDFGVHRLWSELSREHPHFEFHHGYGLGVLAVGEQVPTRFRKFLEDAAANAEKVRAFYAALGQRIELARGLGLLTRQLKAQIASANRWREHEGAPALPPLPASGAGPESLAPPGPDPKAWLDRLAWFSANVSGDFAHCVAAARAARPVARS